jgi:hypothetical protein
MSAFRIFDCHQHVGSLDTGGNQSAKAAWTMEDDPTQVRFIMQMAERCPKLLFDSAIAFPLMQYLEEFVRRHGAERLFGRKLVTAL